MFVSKSASSLANHPIYFRLWCRCLLLCCAIGLASIAHAATPLDLQQALELSVQYSSKVQAGQAAVDARDYALLQSDQLPDPELIVGIDNLPIMGADRFAFDAEPMTMRRIGVMQRFTRKHTRQSLRDKAQTQRTLAEEQLQLVELQAQRDTAKAWLELWAVQAELRVLDDWQSVLQLQRETRSAAVSGGRSPADVLTIERRLLQLENRRDALKAVQQSALAMLEELIGIDAQRPLGRALDFAQLPIAAQTLDTYQQHVHLRTFDLREKTAEADIAIAAARKKPDWSVEFSYSDRAGPFDDMVSVMFRYDLPLFPRNRQDANIAERKAMLAQRQAESESARRAHLAKMQTDLATWQLNQRLLKRYREQLLPLAEQQRELATASYQGGGADMDEVLSASIEFSDLQIEAISVEAALGKAWAELNFLDNQNGDAP